MEICTVVTRDREEMVDITERLCAVIREKGWRHGVAALFCPHTTCGLTIGENGGMGKATATRILRRALWDRPCS